MNKKAHMVFAAGLPGNWDMQERIEQTGSALVGQISHAKRDAYYDNRDCKSNVKQKFIDTLEREKISRFLRPNTTPEDAFDACWDRNTKFASLFQVDGSRVVPDLVICDRLLEYM